MTTSRVKLSIKKRTGVLDGTFPHDLPPSAEEVEPSVPKVVRFISRPPKAATKRKRGCCIKTAPKKATANYRQGIELSLALLYNLIAKENLQKSEIIIHQ